MKHTEKLKMSQKFVMEGRFVAIPLEIPGETFPVPPDESAISAIIENPQGDTFFGATGGLKCHVFVGAAKGASRGILDIGVIEGAKSIPVLVYEGIDSENLRFSRNKIIVAANFEEGSCFYRYQIFFPGDTLQEPSFNIPQKEKLAFLPGLKVFDAVIDANGTNLICLTDAGIWILDLQTNDVHAVYEDDLSAIQIKKFAVVNDSTAFFVGKSSRIYQLDLKKHEYSENAMTVPFDGSGCGFCVVDKKIVAANKAGKLFAFDYESCSVNCIGQVMLPDIQCMSALPDGRIYGVCGKGIGYFFKFNLASGQTEEMGAIVSSLGTHRYGFEFSMMLTGSDGEIYLCENDRGGHLWIYFPAFK